MTPAPGILPVRVDAHVAIDDDPRPCTIAVYQMIGGRWVATCRHHGLLSKPSSEKAPARNAATQHARVHRRPELSIAEQAERVYAQHGRTNPELIAWVCASIVWIVASAAAVVVA